MISFRRSRIHRSIITPVLIAVWLAGCTGWQTRREPIPVVMAEREPNRIRVTLLSGEKRDLRDPTVVEGAVNGRWVRKRLADTLVSIPVDSVSRVETRGVSAGRTALLVGTLGLLVAAYMTDSGSVGCVLCTPTRPGQEDERQSISCPLVYSWDGDAWRLDSGTFGGAIFRPLARTDLDNLDRVVPIDGMLRLKLANELPEIEHVDEIAVLAVDHPPGTAVVPDGSGRPHGLVEPQPPVVATDERGDNVLGSLVWSDGWTWESRLFHRDTADVASLRDGVELAFERPAGVREARLLLDGRNTEWAAALVNAYVQLHGSTGPAWYAAMNEDAEAAGAIGEAFASAGFLQAEILTRTGWERAGRFWEAGPEVAKRQVLTLDLSDVEGDRVRIRLSSLPSFWQLDRVAMDFGPEPAISVAPARLLSARTRNGDDVLAPLAARDGREWEMRDGDFALLAFDPPPVSPDVERSYLLRTHGWYQIESRREGPAATALLERLAEGPEGIARLAVALQNDALSITMGTTERHASDAGGGDR